MKIKIFIPILCFALGAAAAFYLGPKRQLPGSNTETTRTITRTRTVKVPGKTITETVIVDSGSKVQLPAAAKKWAIDAGIHTAFDGIKPDYSLTVSRRIVGPFSVVGMGRTDGSLGLGFRFEF